MLSSVDNELLNSYCIERGLKYRTIQGYKDSLKKFTEFTGRSFVKSLKIYDQEEEKRVRWKYTTLKKDLLNFRNYLYNNLLGTTAKSHFSRLCTMIRHYEISILYLPRVNLKNVNSNPPVNYDDLLTLDELRSILKISNPLMKALVSFQISSGCARKETLSLTVSDYIKANDVIIKDDDLIKSINQINAHQVPIFRCKRVKTNKYYFTFCTPEANNYIKEYLLTRKNLSLDKPLFKTNLDYLNTAFKKINSCLNLGLVSGKRRCRTHMFRKYNASTLYNNGMSIEDVDSLQGRGKDSTHSSYFMEDPELLKQKYLKYIPVLTIGEW